MPRTATNKVSNISTKKSYKPRAKKTTKKTYKKSLDRHMSAYAKILNNPFSEYVHPAPVPDGFGGRTVTMKLIFNQTITTDANGAWAAQYFPSPDNFRRNATTIASDVPTVFGGISPHGQWSQFSASAFSVKPVCLATKVSYVGRSELMSGTVSFMISNETTTTDIPAISSWGSEQGTHALTTPCRMRSIEAVSKLHDLPEFVTVPAAADAHIQSMSPILIGGSGWPASTASAYVESVLYVEILPKINSSLSFSETPSGTSANFHTGVENHISESPSHKRLRIGGVTIPV